MSVLASFMLPHPPMIIPAVGKGTEVQIKATAEAYRKVADEIAFLKPDTIIISSPHAIMYSDYFHISPGNTAFGSLAQFHAAEISFHEHYDTVLVNAIERIAEENGLPAGTEGERNPELDHGTMVPLWFIRQAYTNFMLVRIGLSGLSFTEHYRLGQIINLAVEETDRRAVFIASGDLSHKLQTYGPYGYSQEGPQYDSRVMDVCGRAAFGELFDFEESFCRKAAECGHRSFLIMAGVLDGLDVMAAPLSHEDTTGVGYGICSFYPGTKNRERCFLETYLKRMETELAINCSKEDPWVALARKTVETYVLNRTVIQVPKDLPPELSCRKAGAFVSIHKHGQLRGCIGTILPTEECLALEIIQNAVNACSRDPRFPPIAPDELAFLVISVDVLGEPEEINSASDLDVKRYGVIVSSGFRRGLLLPDLDGVDTVEQQISIARQKAGIRPSEKISLQRFEVVRHH